MRFRRTIGCSLVALLCLQGNGTPAYGQSLTVDNFDVGQINPPSGVLSTSSDTRGLRVSQVEDLQSGFDNDDVIGGSRSFRLTADNDKSSVHTEVQLSPGADGALSIQMGSDGVVGASYFGLGSGPGPLADIFGSDQFEAFQISFAQAPIAGSATVSLRGDFPEGGNQLFTTAAPISGPGLLRIPFTELMGEFGGPTGSLGVVNNFLLIIRGPVGVSSDSVFSYEISDFSVVGVVPEPATLPVAALAALPLLTRRASPRAAVRP